jgi:hypothetical protein
MAPFFLVAVVTIAIAMPAAGGPAYHGAFPLLAIASAGLLLGLQQRGAVTSALSWRPLVGLGAISYGVYLFHFPVFVFLSADRVGSGGVLLLAARFATTLAIAVASYWLIERPIRRATWSGSRTLMHAVIALGLVAVAVEVVPTSDATYWTANASAVAAAGIPQDQDVGAVATVPPPTPTSAPVPTTGAPTAPTDAPSPAEGPGLDSATSARPGSTSPIPTGTVPTTDPETSSVAVTNSSVAADTVTITNSSVPAPDDTLLIVPAVPMLSRPVRIVVVGDSTAEAAGAGLVQWAALNPDVAKVTVIAAAGCGFVRSGAVSTEGGAVDAPNNFASDCRHQLDVLLPDALSSLHPDVVMLMNTVNDVLPRAFDDSGTLLTPIDHEFLTRAIPDYLTLEEFILDNSTAHVAWIRPPAIDPYWLDKTMPARDPVSRSTIDHVMTTVIAVHPGRATVIDLRTWLEQQGLADDHEYRPDGIHEDLDSATDLAARFLGPELVAEAIRVD